LDGRPAGKTVGTQASRGLDYSRFDAIANSSDEEAEEEKPRSRPSVHSLLSLPKPVDLEPPKVGSEKDANRRPQTQLPLELMDPARPPGPSELVRASSSPRPTSEPGVRVRFLYASPLFSGGNVPALDTRADLEGLRAASGICAEVRVATVDRLRGALLARPSPGILHISAHCLRSGGNLCLALEDSFGAPHILPASDLATQGPWDGVELLVFLSCHSEAFARELVRSCGLRRVICCSFVVLDQAAQVFCGAFYQALGAGRALLSCHEIARAAVRSSADERISMEADKFVLLGEPAPPQNGQPSALWSPALTSVALEPWPSWPRWPSVEDFVGRQDFAVAAARAFEHRRVLCLAGARGIGKTAFCHGFCHHFSAPGGRRFSAGAFLVDYVSTVRGAAGEHPDAFALAILNELRAGSSRRPAPPGEEAGGGANGGAGPAQALTVRQALRQEVRRFDEGGQWLLVVDGLPRSNAAAARGLSHSPSASSCCFSSGPSSEASDEEGGGWSPGSEPRTPLDCLHGVLEELLCTSAQLRILLTARVPPRGPWAALGLSKVVEVELPPLAPDDAARLLARRAARPFYRRDFGVVTVGAGGGGSGASGGSGGNAGEPLPLDGELLGLLAACPLALKLGGSPGRIVAAAAEVHAGLPSLLRHPWLMPALV